MTWSINLDVKGGKISPESIRIGGTPPDGPLTVNGYENREGRGVGVNMGGMYGSFYAAAAPAIAPPLKPGPAVDVDAEQLARAAYRAYGDQTDNKNHRGEPMPNWDDLGDTIRAAWTKGAIAVVRKAIEGES